MYTSIRKYEGIDPNIIDEVIRGVEESFVPVLSKSSGFIGYYLVKAEDGAMATISMFETKEETEESNKVAARWVKENFPEFVSGPPQITAGDTKIVITS